ncbi:MAG: hypothetical protein H7X91_11625 [Burkholderiales bacterium]|nr:hypothetical protein [Burkholderiales bacterium]
MARCHDAQDHLGLGPLPEGDFNTIAGLVLFLFGRIPALGERIAGKGGTSRSCGWTDGASTNCSHAALLRLKLQMHRRMLRQRKCVGRSSHDGCLQTYTGLTSALTR